MSPDYNFSPMRASEEAPNGKYNLPPALRFTDGRSGDRGRLPPWRPRSAEDSNRQHPDAARTVRRRRCALLERHQCADDAHADGRRSDGREISRTRAASRWTACTSSPRSRAASRLEPYAGKSTGTVTFSAPGDYIVHVTSERLLGKGRRRHGLLLDHLDDQGQRQVSRATPPGPTTFGFPCFGGETRSSRTQHHQPHSSTPHRPTARHSPTADSPIPHALHELAQTR